MKSSNPILGRIFYGLALLAAASVSSCTPSYYAKDADREVIPILESLHKTHLDSRPATVLQPKPAPEPEARVQGAENAEISPTPKAPARRFGVRDVMRLATVQSRDFQTQRESLFKNILGLTLTRYNFGPKFSGALSYLYSNATGSSGGSATGSSSASLTGSKILPTGGTLSVTGTSNVSGEEGVGFDGNRSFDSTITSSLTQKLWRGAGYEPSHEALTAAERGAVYAVRSFELFREDFSIQTLTKHYNLVSQRRTIDNQRRSLENFIFLRRRSEALFEVGRVPQLDVLRARQQELSAQNNLIQAEESYQSALNSFKIFLSLDPEEEIEIADETPPFVPIRLDEQSAIEAALANRLDFHTSKDRVADSERAVRLAKDGLRPDLDLALSHSFGAPAADQFAVEPFSDQSWSAGLTLGLPLNRKSERNSYRAALIDLNQQRRNFERDRDNLVEEVRGTLRKLRRSENTLEIQKMIIASEEKRLAVAQIRFQAGQIGNRDVVEAQQGLLSAQNSYIGDLVAYEIARIQLRRDLGTLFLDQDGMPVE